MGCDSKVAHNLALLQEKLGQDPESYKEEFVDQLNHFRSLLQLIELQPGFKQDGLIEVVFFLSNCAPYYPDMAVDFCRELVTLLKKSASCLQPFVRMALCKSLLVLNTRQLIGLKDLVQLFMELLKCRDKALRMFLFTATVARIKRANGRRQDQQLNSALQSMLLWHSDEASAVTARFAVLVLIDLYRRRIWKCAKVANGVAQVCLNPVTKIAVAAMRFMLGSDVAYSRGGDDESDEVEVEEDEEEDQGAVNTRRYKTLKDMLMAYRVGKKSKKRCRVLEKAKQAMKKKQEQKVKRKKSCLSDTSAIEMLYDAHEFAEKLLQKLRTSTDRFEVRLLYMALISRVIMVHGVLLLNFYPFLQRYLTPHQRHVTKILLFAAHSSHDLVPPDVVQEMVGVIAYNFITDRNSSEAITVGLNAIREIVTKCPLAVTTELMGDLAAYKKYKNKNVSMGAKSLINLFRRINPKALAKRDRGRPTMASVQDGGIVKAYGHLQPSSYVQGAEVLAAGLGEDEDEEEGMQEDQSTGENSDGGSWVDVSDDDDLSTAVAAECTEEVAPPRGDIASAEQICCSKIFTQKDFEKISAARTVNEVVPASKKRKAVWQSAGGGVDGGVVTRLKDIEHLSKRPKQDKASRVESAKAGRDPDRQFGRPKRRGPHVGRNKRELGKRKVFSMVKHKLAKRNKNRSFRDQQRTLRQYLLKQGKMR